MIIFTHRGLEPSNKEAFPESSHEQFKNHLEKGYGIEFDPVFIKDGIVVFHDSNLKRITKGKDEREFSEISLNELKNIGYGGNKKGTISEFREILNLIKISGTKMNAIHLKGKFQSKEKIDLLIEVLKEYKEIFDKILIFDLKPEDARYIKLNLTDINLALSVSHPHDIKRYNSVVGETLFSIEEAINLFRERICSWVWLDEWDLIDSNNNKKKLYNKEVFDKLRNAGYKIALVTPELHGASPDLLGAESHEDAKEQKTLFKRVKEIISLNPDAICTDYPDEVRRIYNNLKNNKK